MANLTPEQLYRQKKTRWEIAKHDPWYFLRYFTFTIDTHDKVHRVRKPFPATAYSRIYCRFWQEVDTGFCEKSRQIRITWENMALDLWDVMFNPGKLTFYQSKKQPDANAILERSQFIYNALRMDPDLVEWGIPQVRFSGEKAGTNTVMEFPANYSKIVAIPQGGDILRMHTASKIFSDENNFQPEAEDAYAGAKPTVEGGGQWIAVSTPNGMTHMYYTLYCIDPNTGEPRGEHRKDSKTIQKRDLVPPFTGDMNNLDDVENHRRLIEKTIIEMDDETFYGVPLEELVANMPGMAYWQTFDGVHCLRIHYSSDPEKSPQTAAGRAWIAKARQGVSPDAWAREYEISYKTFAGRPVISSYRRELHVAHLEYNSELPLLISFDFGRPCGCLIGQFGLLKKFPVHRLNILAELLLYGDNAKTQLMAEALSSLIQARFPRSWSRRWFNCYCDPNGDRRSETTADASLDSNMKILETHGYRCNNQKFNVPESTQMMDAVFAMILPDSYPAVMIDESCEYLITVVGGGLHYPKKILPGDEWYYEKDGINDHGGDMLRYMVANNFNPRDFGPKRDEKQPDKFRPVFRDFTGEFIGYARKAPSGRGHPVYGR